MKLACKTNPVSVFTCSPRPSNHDVVTSTRFCFLKITTMISGFDFSVKLVFPLTCERSITWSGVGGVLKVSCDHNVPTQWVMFYLSVYGCRRPDGSLWLVWVSGPGIRLAKDSSRVGKLFLKRCQLWCTSCRACCQIKSLLSAFTNVLLVFICSLFQVLIPEPSRYWRRVLRQTFIL